MERGLSLMLVLSYGGAKSWRALTYRDGKPHYWKLGTYPQVTVQQARRKAREYFENPAEGGKRRRGRHLQGSGGELVPAATSSKKKS